MISKKPYRGINVFILSLMGYKSPFWLSYKQASELGGQVKKGEHGCPVVFWKWIEVIEDESGNKLDKPKKIPFLRYYTVFNSEQCDGIETPPIDHKPHDFIPLAEAEKIANNMPNPPKLTFEENRAYYRASTDTVNMPKKEDFDGAEEYYCTLFHELGHSTGHKTRLDRFEPGAQFGSDPYAREELVAELCSAILCGETGLNPNIEQTSAYIANWRKVILDKPGIVLKAASQAQIAAEWILGEGR
jgi:antirestriction protein ArdC